MEPAECIVACQEAIQAHAYWRSRIPPEKLRARANELLLLPGMRGATAPRSLGW